MTAAANTGPARQPRPASSRPASIVSGERKGRSMARASEHFGYLQDAVGERVDFLLCVVECERGADCPFASETAHEGLGAMVAGADGNAQAVEEST